MKTYEPQSTNAVVRYTRCVCGAVIYHDTRFGPCRWVHLGHTQTGDHVAAPRNGRTQ